MYRLINDFDANDCCNLCSTTLDDAYDEALQILGYRVVERNDGDEDEKSD